MDRMQYFNKRQELVKQFGEGSAQVNNLDNQRSQELRIEQAGGQAVDVSNQSQQGPIRRPVNPLSDEDIEEANWLHRQIQKEENREAYAEIKREIEDPDNWVD